MSGLNVRKPDGKSESQDKLNMLVTKRGESKIARKQTENDIDKLNKQIGEAIASGVKTHYKDTHFRSSVIISEKSTEVRLEVDSWTFLTEALLHNVMARPDECITDVKTAIDKLLEIREKFDYSASNDSFNIRRDEKGSTPIVNVSFNTRTKYF